MEPPPPKQLIDEEVLKMIENVENLQGKSKLHKKKKRVSGGEEMCYKKKSTFFKLLYLRHLKCFYQLDVMYIEKNVCENIYGTLLNILCETKDGLNTILDLVDIEIRTNLAPKKVNNYMSLPLVCYTSS